MFGLFNPQNNPPQQPAFGQQPPQQPFGQPQQPQPLNFEGKQIHPYYVQQIQQLTDVVNQTQAENNLRSLMFFVELEAAVSKEVVERACNYEFSKEEKMEHLEYNRERCVKIKTRNAQILARLMNLRLKLISNMNMYKTRSSEREQEIGLLNEKIRDLKCSITYKYNRIKSVKNSRSNEYAKQGDRSTTSGLQVPLVQLKKGVQLLQREAIRLREEISLLLKYMHGNTI